MEVKDLNKSQLILLTILCSFVVSIATGIVTVTLLQAAPVSVTKTITNVVEKTIEKAVPGTVTNNTKTVVIKEEDLVVSAIEKNNPSLVTVFRLTDAVAGTTTTLGHGFVADASGTILVPRDLIDYGGTYLALISGKKFTIQLVGRTIDEKTGLAKYHLDLSGDDKGAKFTPVEFGNVADLKIGQTLIVLGSDSDSFRKGIMSGLGHLTLSLDSGKDLKLDVPQVNFSLSNSMIGAPVINLNGEVVAVVLAGNSGPILYPAGIVASFASAK